MKAGYQGKGDSMRAYAARMLHKNNGGAVKNMASVGKDEGAKLSGKSEMNYSMKTRPSASAADKIPPRLYKKGGKCYEEGGPSSARYSFSGGMGSARPAMKKGGMCKSDGGEIAGIAKKVVKVMNSAPVKAITHRFMKKGGKTEMTSKMTGGRLGIRYEKGGEAKFALGGAGKVRKGMMTATGKIIKKPANPRGK